MSTYQWRRFLILWTPIYVAGIALMAVASTLTTHTNGLTILGGLTAMAGLMAAAHDNRSTT